VEDPATAVEDPATAVAVVGVSVVAICIGLLFFTSGVWFAVRFLRALVYPFVALFFAAIMAYLCFSALWYVERRIGLKITLSVVQSSSTYLFAAFLDSSREMYSRIMLLISDFSLPDFSGYFFE
jgi:small-conductance mechanosensitive channel